MSKQSRRRPGRPKGSNYQAGFRVVPVWKQTFDEEAFARALLLLAMHLDETGQVVHTKTHSNTHEEGERHE